MNKNERLFGLYRVFAYDYLFYTVIVFLFQTQTKGLNVGDVMHISAFYAVFSGIMQIPCNYLVEFIGLKKSMILGNVFLIIHCIMYIFLCSWLLLKKCFRIASSIFQFKKEWERKGIWQNRREVRF